MGNLPDDTHPDDPTRALARLRELRDMVSDIEALGRAGWSVARGRAYFEGLHEFYRLLRESPVFAEVRDYGSPFLRRLDDPLDPPPWDERRWSQFHAGVAATEARLVAALRAAGANVHAAERGIENEPRPKNRAQRRSEDRRVRARAMRAKGCTLDQIRRALDLKSVRRVQQLLESDMK